MINQTPRAKNLFVKSRMKSFIEYVNTVEPQCPIPDAEEEVSNKEDNPSKKKDKRAGKESNDHCYDRDEQDRGGTCSLGVALKFEA